MTGEIARRALVAFSFALFGTVLVQDAAAQCPVPDNLDPGPCCTQALVNAPRAPNFKQQSLSICWQDCNIDSILACTAVWSGPTPPEDCTSYAKRLRIEDPGAVTTWNGRVNMRYSRTWIETDSAGIDRQVWRYLANGDLVPTAAAGVPPCPVPPCSPAFGGKVRFTGYVDYALDCSSGLKEYAWMLSHECDLIDHAPGFPRAGAFHPDRTYTFVGPAAGFVVTPLVSIEAGAGTLEAVRRIGRLPGTTIDFCEFEEPIQHSLTPLQQLCLCGSAAAPPQHVISDLKITGACGTTVAIGGPFLPGFISKGIGFWTDPTKYPGPEELRWNAGGYRYGDPCVGVLQDEVFYGVTTLRGWPPRQIPSGLPLPDVFVDQGNSLMGILGTVTMNVPFRSTHILNLNY